MQGRMAGSPDARATPRRPRSRRRFLAPEVVQTSPMDCGPASLKCLLEGFGIPVAYGRLREAVQTEVDGTSIDALTETARALGLDAQQILVPVDHVGHPSAPTLPAIAVVRLPSGANHFAVAWRRTGSSVQVMDPASGRHRIRIEEFRRKLYVHGTRIPAAAWRRFAGAPHALAVLRHDLARLGHRRPNEIVAEAASDDTWRSLAALESAARMTTALRAKGAIGRGAEAAAFFDSVYAAARRDDPAKHLAIPAAYWSARPAGTLEDGEPALFVRGALLVRVRGRAEESREAGGSVDRSLPAELRAAIAEPPARPLRAILAEIAPRERRATLGLAGAALLAALAILVQSLVFQSLVLVGARFSLDEQRVGVVAALLAVVAGVLLLELPLGAAFLRFGRILETRWRAAFQRRLPLLPERWFSSRPSSDMAERAHGLSVLRGLPGLAGRGVRSLFQLALTAAGLVWLDPAAWPLVLAAALAATLVPLAFQAALHERELSLRNHHGALGRSYLETLLGLVAVRVHGAERRLRREHEGMLVEWLRAGRKLARATTAARAATAIAGLGTAVLLVLQHVARHPADPGTLLFAYWALSLSSLGDQLAQIAEQLPAMRNATLRALEPISAQTEPEPTAEAEDVASDELETVLAPAPLLMAAGAAGAAGAASPSVAQEKATSCVPPAPVAGVRLSLRAVEVRIGGHPVLTDVDLEVAPGEHVAIVGASGAGKSTLIALLLGFHRASAGTVLADGERRSPRSTADLRRATAWIDPSVQLFNQSLFENLVYGAGTAGTGALAASIEDANLREVLEGLPQALDTPLGEGGGFLSAGEAQRVRLARALLRPGVRLALLDEPFRGLDRDTRRDLLARARRRFAAATLLCATHDLAETLAFDRAVVLDGGRVVADGAPRDLLADRDGAYARLVRAERELAETLTASPTWTRWRVADGRVEVERGSAKTEGPA